MKNRLMAASRRQITLLQLSACLDRLRIQSCYIQTAAKRIIFFLLIGQFICLAGRSQTSHSRWKQNFDVHDFHTQAIEIAEPSAPILQLAHLHNITVVDARADTSAIGFMQKTVIEPFFGALNNAARNQTEQRINRMPTFLTLDQGLQRATTQFLQQTILFAADDSVPGVLMVIKKLWLSDELNLDKPGTATERIAWPHNKDRWTSGIDANIEFYLQTASGYYPLYRFDSVISKTLTVSEYGPQFIALALQLSLQRLLQMDNKIAAITNRRRFSLEEIKTHNEDAYDIPVLKDAALQAGVYMTFEEFRNNQPSQKSFVLQKGRQSNIVYVKQSDGTEHVANDAWGYCDGKNSFIRSTDNFYLLQRIENAFYIFGTKNIKWVITGVPGTATNYSSAGSGFYGVPSSGGYVRELQLKPFQLDWATGKLY